MSHRCKRDHGTPIPVGPHDATENCAQRCARRHLRALIAVARAYRLAPKLAAEGVYHARCPSCPPGARGRTLVIHAGAFACRECGSHGSRLNGLQRLAEGRYVADNDDAESPVDLPRIRAALARLDAVVAAGGDLAGEVCEAKAAELWGKVAELPDVQAANDDVEVCPCPDCEGRGDAGEGDA